jgi:RNA polymerase sigma factor (sigma-70 family)
MNQYRPETFKAANRVRPKREPVEALPSWITPRFAKRSAACACLVAGPHWRCVWLPPSKPLPSIITRRVREIAVEAAKLEQLRLEREHCGAIARIEKVIDSGFGVGGACSGPFSPIKDPVGAYLHEAAAAPLLSREEEVAIAKRIEAGGEDGQRAKDEMARANLRLVVSVAKKYTDNRGARFLDMIQEGNFGLTKAIDKFEWGRGYKFSTMATLWIGDAITRPLKKVEEKLKTISWENLDDFAASPAEGWPGVPAKKKSVPKYDDPDTDDQSFANGASYSSGSLVAARKRTAETSATSVFSRSGFGVGLSLYDGYRRAADYVESDKAKNIRQEKADGTYDDPSEGMEEL